MTATQQLYKGAPPSRPTDIIAWAEKNVRLKGSVISETFDRNNAPWLIEPIQRCMDSETRIVTLIKPVQTGGSAAGLIVACAWARWGWNLIQYNWENQTPKAENRWDKVILPTLRACLDLQWKGGRFDDAGMEAEFVNSFIRCQGVLGEGKLSSDPVPRQINEEIHDWPAGHLSMARGRQTAVFNPKAFDISNAGLAIPKNYKSDGSGNYQLHEAFLNGTQQHWEVKCPGCGLYHEMHTRWDDKHPELGGLRYDTEGCKRADGTFDYNRLEGTIFYQMPCGYKVHNNRRERRALSSSGRYSDPKNTGAHLSHRSYNYDAVAVDYIDWLVLVQEKHAALRARKHGDKKPWEKYITERECRFYSEDDAPLVGIVVTSQKIKKNRDGLRKHPDFATRLAAADRQRGHKARGELSHYWLVIEDVLSSCDSQVVFEGLVQTDSELVAVLDDHGVPHNCCFVDASWDTKHILEMCYRNGLNAFQANASHKGSFLHSDGIRRFYSDEKAIHAELNTSPRFDYSPTKDGWVMSPNEPIVISYNKAGLLANHFLIRDHKMNVLASNPKATPADYITREIPGDVSEEFTHQCESWERVTLTKPATKDDVEGFQKVRDEDHLLMCLGYIDLLKDWSLILGDRLAKLGVKRP